MDVRSLFIADAQSAELIQPGEGSFYGTRRCGESLIAATERKYAEQARQLSGMASACLNYAFPMPSERSNERAEGQAAAAKTLSRERSLFSRFRIAMGRLKR